MPERRIVGIDPGLNITGYGVVAIRAGGIELVEGGTIRPGGSRNPLEARLKRLFCDVADLLHEIAPEVVAIEDLYSRYERPKTAILMGHARGVIVLAAGLAGVIGGDRCQTCHHRRRPCRKSESAASRNRNPGLGGNPTPTRRRRCAGNCADLRQRAKIAHMIAFIEGVLAEIQSDRIVVDVSGVGYEILVPYFVKRGFEERMSAAGEGPLKVKVVTLYRVSERNPKPELIGFETVDQRLFFEKLLTVSGVGAAKAAKALVFSVSTIAKAIEDGDVDKLARLPGFGRRTAEKVIAELRGKVLKEALIQDQAYSDMPSLDQEIDKEATEVLRRLGFTAAEAKLAITAARKRAGTIESAEDLVQESLRSQGRTG